MESIVGPGGGNGDNIALVIFVMVIEHIPVDPVMDIILSYQNADPCVTIFVLP